MLDKKLVSVCEGLGWTVHEDEESGEVELSQNSPAGEDFRFTVDSDCFVGNVGAYFESFDVDEHVAMWIMARKSGVSGVPGASALVHDAEAIDTMLLNLYEALCDSRAGKRRFTFTYREHSIMTVDIMAKSSEEAKEEWDYMLSEGKINFSHMDVYDTELEIEEDPEDGE